MSESLFAPYGMLTSTPDARDVAELERLCERYPELAAEKAAEVLARRQEGTA